jgi:LysR family transcriptional regulator, low CO2-responsive transcriptional regulator
LTLTQLKAFLAVARLGSVKAAATSLGVTEPAVSGAVGVLRKELGDQLFLRSGNGIALTSGGRRLAATAAEMLGLAAQTRRSVSDSEATRLIVAATPIVAEHVVPWLLEAFCARQPGLETGTLAVAASAFVELLRDRRADVALGPRPAAEGNPPVDSVPFLRFALTVVTSPDRARRLRPPVSAADLARQPWLLGPAGTERGTLTGDFLAGLAVDPARISTYPSSATALQLASEGEGLTMAFRHTVRAELQRGSLISVDVAVPTPHGLLYANTLGAGRCSPAAAALCHFIATPTATQAVLMHAGGRPARQFKPPVYVTLWS